MFHEAYITNSAGHLGHRLLMNLLFNVLLTGSQIINNVNKLQRSFTRVNMEATIPIIFLYITAICYILVAM
jgi:hypothetical protein